MLPDKFPELNRGCLVVRIKDFIAQCVSWTPNPGLVCLKYHNPCWLTFLSTDGDTKASSIAVM